MKENIEIPKELRELFIPYELAYHLQHPNPKEVKYSAFDTECIAFWNHYREVHFNHTYDDYARHLKAPMYQQVVDWFRDKHNIEIYCQNYYRGNKDYKAEYEIRINGKQLSNDYSSSSSVVLYAKYYEALTKAIEEALKLI